MLSNMNQQSLDGTIHMSNNYFNNSHSTKNETKEFSIYRPDVDFSLNYEPVGDVAKTRLVSDAKESSASNLVNGDSSSGVENGFVAVKTTMAKTEKILDLINPWEDPINLHNYSKVPESLKRAENSDKNNNKNIDKSDEGSLDMQNQSDQDEIIGSRDDNNNPSNKNEDKQPEHHIRRPMNAFLIFCKRHRALVREKYPNLENRSITKILGDWWAFLPNDDKLPYKELAKNYKDVFFSKNPNFKWYKLPAPPLRTLSTRPTNDRSMAPSPTPSNGEDSGDLTVKERVVRSIKSTLPVGAGISQFKFASIDQMGGLTSLMSFENGTSNGIYVHVKDEVSRKRHAEEQIEFVEEELNSSGKSHRACKGKRYEQFMTPSKKTTKQRSTNSSSTTSSTSPVIIENGYTSKKHQESATNHHKNQYDSSDELNNIPSPESDEAEIRNVDAADFKLNEKIMTLPSLDLDDYLNRKKAMKKKKKFSHKAKQRQQQAQATPKDKVIPKPNAIVGSQKRKAPKEMIRRATEINQTEISSGLIGLNTLATLALVQANSSTPQ